MVGKLWFWIWYTRLVWNNNSSHCHCIQSCLLFIILQTHILNLYVFLCTDSVIHITLEYIFIILSLKNNVWQIFFQYKSREGINILTLEKKSQLSGLQPISKRSVTNVLMNSPLWNNFVIDVGSERFSKSQLIFNKLCNIYTIAQAVMRTKWEALWLNMCLVMHGNEQTHIYHRNMTVGELHPCFRGSDHLCTVAYSVPIKMV